MVVDKTSSTADDMEYMGVTRQSTHPNNIPIRKVAGARNDFMVMVSLRVIIVFGNKETTERKLQPQGTWGRVSASLDHQVAKNKRAIHVCPFKHRVLGRGNSEKTQETKSWVVPKRLPRGSNSTKWPRRTDTG